MVTLINQSQTFSNISATTAAFALSDGLYGITAKATWGGGSVTLQKQAADGSSWVTAATAISADGYSTVSLPGGTYRFLVATATAIYLDISSIVS